MCIYIHNKYTQDTHILFEQNILFWMPVIAIKRLTALQSIHADRNKIQENTAALLCFRVHILLAFEGTVSENQHTVVLCEHLFPMMKHL